jgi:riboflavin kinase/FMN adenylyltransferase
MAERSAEGFAGDILHRGLGVAHVVVGEDFCFGKGRSGTARTLKELGRAMRFGVDAVAAAADENGIVYSSTAIRQRLSAGEPEGVIGLLGRPWEIAGRVEHGDERGRKLGFPTANLAMGEYMEPKLGVYAIRAALDEGGAPRWFDGVANLGRRPTIGGTRVQLEVHLFDFSQDLYGKHLRVALLGFIRPEMKFDGLEALRARIGEDCRAARAIAGAYGGPMPGLLGPGPAAM